MEVYLSPPTFFALLLVIFFFATTLWYRHKWKSAEYKCAGLLGGRDKSANEALTWKMKYEECQDGWSRLREQ